MLRLGLILGMIGGAIAAALLSAPKDEEAAPEVHGLMGQVKSQFQQARRAARQEMHEKEAELMREYEESQHSANS